MGERMVFHANFNGAIDTTRQAIKDGLDQEDLKQHINMDKSLTGGTSKESNEHVKKKLACISDHVKYNVLIEELQELHISI